MSTEIPFSQLATWCQEEGIAALATMPLPETMPSEGLDQLLSDGIGDMAYLSEQYELRRHPRRLLPGSSHCLIAALPYQGQRPEGDSDASLRCARYAAGKDYHNIFRRMLARVGNRIGAREPTAQTRACVDSAPLNERDLAQGAGIGWLGRNGLIIDPQRGSYHFLGVLLSTVPLEIHHGGHGADRCGSCRACHSACPTAALLGRRVLSTRCISYLTIEHHGVIPRDLAQHFQGWWYGCDICQEQCPWNRFAGRAAVDDRLRGSSDDASLLAISAETFDQHFAGRPQRRIGFERFRRNLLVALWSRGDYGRAQRIAAETPLPLILAQAQELALPCAAAPHTGPHE